MAAQKGLIDIPLMHALLHLQQLQFENDAGAAHDLLPAQTALHELLNHVHLQRGLVRRWIETDPDVAVLRNKADAWNPPPDADEIRVLMRCRNESAQILGYADYPWAILSADGLNPPLLRQRLINLLDVHLASAAAAARAMGVDSMADWYPFFHQAGRLEKALDPLRLLQAMANMLGLQDVLAQTEISVVENGSCFAAQIGKNAYRMQVMPLDTLDGWRTLFHEFGHVCTYALLREGQLPWLSAVTDEMLAVLTEHASAYLLADEPLRSRLLQEMDCDYTRCAVSALYELDLWQQPQQAEALYLRHYGQLVPHPDASAWARDSFRSIDPMTVHGYALGHALAQSAAPQRWIHRLSDIRRKAADLTVPELEHLVRT